MSNKKNCAGTYPVRGYKRSDGTEVSAYMRTCGAKHVGGSGTLTGTAGNIDDIDLNFIDKLYYLSAIYNEIKNSRLDEFEYLQRVVAINNILPITFMKYYQLALDFENQKQFNKDNAYYKFKDIDDDGLRYHLQYEVDNLKGKIDDYTDVVIPQYNSPLFKKIMNSKELKNVLNANLSQIINGNNNDILITFENYYNLPLVLGHGRLYNMRIKDECICGSYIDYYDFNKIIRKTDNSLILSFIINANNNAYEQQEIGDLTNYLIIMPIRYPVKNLR